MNEHTESLLREHLRSVDTATVPVSSAIGERVSRVERRMARRRRGLAATSAIALVGLAVGFAWNTSAGPQQITGADGLPSTTSSVSTDVPTTDADDTTPWKAIPVGLKPVTGATVVWTGTEALMIGGTFADGSLSGIHAYNPTTETWRIGSPEAAVSGNPLAAWLGTALVLISSSEQTVVLYDPVQGVISSQRTDMALFYVDGTVPWAWTGAELLVWPTAMQVTPAPSPRAFDPLTGEWRIIAEPPVEARTSAASVWTGTEWIVWGGSRGSNYFDDGAAYNPSTDTWRLLAASPLPARQPPAVWTGTEMIITAGIGGGGNALADGAAYDPLTDTWRTIAPGFGHPGFQPVWTGELLVLFAKGGAVWYDPLTDQWSTGDMNFGDVPHLDHSPVWTGKVVLLLGSYDGSTGGAAFTPPSR